MSTANLLRTISGRQTPTTRRRFLLASSAFAASSLCGSDVSSAETDRVTLKPSAQDLLRVRIEMDVKGNVNVPKNPLISRKSDLKLPIKSRAVFDYEERYRQPSGANDDSRVTFVERYYHEAQNQSLLNRNQQTTLLRDSARQTIVRREILPEVIYSVEDYFQRDELELLRVPASSVSADELLPREAVKPGSSYKPSADAIVSFLNLSSVESTNVTVEVVSVSQTEARLQFRGNVAGSVAGVPTTIRTIGKLVFDRAVGTCTWLAMAVHETREVGKAEPGFDVSATLKMIRKPLSETIALPAVPPKVDVTAPIPSHRLYVDLRSKELGVSVLMNRSWRMMTDAPGAAMMRMIENDRSIAQCDFRPLVSLQPGAQWTLEAFQADVEKTLGEQLSEMIEADQRVTDAGLRVLRVTALGDVEGIPIRWVVLHFSDDSGRRVLATFTMEGDSVETFAGADSQLANSLSFTELTAQDATEGSSPAVTEKAAETTRTTRVATAKSDEISDESVSSPSDLK